MRSWLIIDSDFMCHRALHTFKELSHNEVLTGVIFGYLRAVEDLVDTFQAHGVVHCFNYGRNDRYELFPDYKIKRRSKQKEGTDEEVKMWKEFDRQRNLLRTTYLPMLGYNNVAYEEGKESDDTMAAVVLPEGDHGVLITSDGDLLQCIRPNIIFFDPQRNKRVTWQSYQKEHGILAKDHWKVLTLAGCATDEVPGLPGIGKKTAYKYLRGELPKHHKTYATIKSGFKRILKQNKPLVKLPFPGTAPQHVKNDEFSIEKWNELCGDLGMKSLRRKDRGRKKLKRRSV